MSYAHSVVTANSCTTSETVVVDLHTCAFEGNVRRLNQHAARIGGPCTKCRKVGYRTIYYDRRAVGPWMISGDSDTTGEPR